jgi:hypothetical protein
MASEAGAAYVTGIALHLRGEVRNLFFEWLHEHRPDLVPLYKRLYQRGAYLHPDERRRLGELVKGPELPPGERMRGGLKLGVGRPADVAGRSGVANLDSPGDTGEPGWSPEQGRLF